LGDVTEARRAAVMDLAKLLATLTLAFSIGISSSAQSSLAPIDDPEAYAVYASLLPREWLVATAHAAVLVFQRETTIFPGCRPSGKPLETDWREVFDNFTAA